MLYRWTYCVNQFVHQHKAKVIYIIHTDIYCYFYSICNYMNYWCLYNCVHTFSCHCIWRVQQINSILLVLRCHWFYLLWQSSEKLNKVTIMLCYNDYYCAHTHIEQTDCEQIHTAHYIANNNWLQDVRVSCIQTACLYSVMWPKRGQNPALLTSVWLRETIDRGWWD